MQPRYKMITNLDIINTLKKYRDERGGARKYLPSLLRDSESKEIKALLKLADSFDAKNEPTKLDDLKKFTNQKETPLDANQLFILTEILLNDKSLADSKTRNVLNDLAKLYEYNNAPLEVLLACKTKNIYSAVIVHAIFQLNDPSLVIKVINLYDDMVKRSLRLHMPIVSAETFFIESIKKPSIILQTQRLCDENQLNKNNFELLSKNRQHNNVITEAVNKLDKKEFKHIKKPAAQEFIIKHPLSINRFFHIMQILNRSGINNKGMNEVTYLLCHAPEINNILSFFEKNNIWFNSENIQPVCKALAYKPNNKVVELLEFLQGKFELFNVLPPDNKADQKQQVNNDPLSLTKICSLITKDNANHLMNIKSLFDKLESLGVNLQPSDRLDILHSAIRNANNLVAVIGLIDWINPIAVDKKVFMGFIKDVLNNAADAPDVEIICSLLNEIPGALTFANLKLIFQSNKIAAVADAMKTYQYLGQGFYRTMPWPPSTFHFNDILKNPIAVKKNLENYRGYNAERTALGDYIFTHAEKCNHPIFLNIIKDLERFRMVYHTRKPDEYTQKEIDEYNKLIGYLLKFSLADIKKFKTALNNGILVDAVMFEDNARKYGYNFSDNLIKLVHIMSANRVKINEIFNDIAAPYIKKFAKTNISRAASKHSNPEAKNLLQDSLFHALILDFLYPDPKKLKLQIAKKPAAAKPPQTSSLVQQSDKKSEAFSYQRAVPGLDENPEPTSDKRKVKQQSTDQKSSPSPTKEAPTTVPVSNVNTSAEQKIYDNLSQLIEKIDNEVADGTLKDKLLKLLPPIKDAISKDANYIKNASKEFKSILEQTKRIIVAALREGNIKGLKLHNDQARTVVLKELKIDIEAISHLLSPFLKEQEKPSFRSPRGNWSQT